MDSGVDSRISETVITVFAIQCFLMNAMASERGYAMHEAYVR